MRLSIILFLCSFFLSGCSTKSKEQYRSEGMAIELNKSFGITPSESKPDYPDFYGGYYHDVDGKLVVLVVRGSVNYEKDLEKRVGSNNFMTKECDYSYNELLLVNGEITDFFTSKQNSSIVNEISINSLGIDTRGNRVFVSLKECTSENIALFKRKVSGSPVIKFEEWNGPIIAQ
nr:hypothetical protein [Parabacteroides goldsteinii]